MIHPHDDEPDPLSAHMGNYNFIEMLGTVAFLCRITDTMFVLAVDEINDFKKMVSARTQYFIERNK